jgi:exodeoxyribonuclease V alpha subunit
MAQETIEGVVEDIRFYSPDTGFTVLSLMPTQKRAKGLTEPITVVGKLLDLHPGETIRVTGSWTVHREYGEQFRADSMNLVTTSKDSLRRYVASGMIEGISDVNVRRIMDHFGDNAMEILDQDPSRIHEVPGMKPDRARKIEESWTEHRRSRKAMMFLQNHGIAASLAQRIFDTFGDDTVDEIQNDPYKLTEIDGIDFKTADGIAQSMGLSVEQPERVKAGIIYALTVLTGDGHVYVPRALATEKAADLLGVPVELCETAATSLVKSGGVVGVKKMATINGKLDVLYLTAMHEHEHTAARRLTAIAKHPETALEKAKSIDWDAFFSRLDRKENITLTEQQKAAVHAALTHKVNVLTGGPGTGKTTTLRAVIRALDSIKATYTLASPTGRAARRLAEATGKEASTIHRLLGYNPDNGFLFGEDYPLQTDMVIVDETSMVDIELFRRLLAAIPDPAHLMLVGDIDQLPSVGPGDVLRDVIASDIAHVTRLELIFRQAIDSLIVLNAHKVNKGEMPDLSNEGDDFFLFGAGDDSDEYMSLADLLVDVVENRIPRKFNLDPLTEVQVLAPMYKGDMGIHVLNERLQAVLNPPDPFDDDFQIGGRTFRMGDKVIQTRNNYEKDIYNGDIGFITGIAPESQELEVNIDGRLVDFKWKETYDLFHAYAISIHRSQGSEYPAVVVPIVPQHSRMLQRNLLYTAITRAKKLVVLVGMRRAIQIAVENDRVARRYSGLTWQINSLLKKVE